MAGGGVGGGGGGGHNVRGAAAPAFCSIHCWVVGDKAEQRSSSKDV